MMRNVTTDGRAMVSGERLFSLHDSCGLPLCMSLDRGLNESQMVVEWPSFIEAARRQGWLDQRTYRLIAEGLLEAGVDREYSENVLAHTRRYMVTNPMEIVQ